MNRCLRIGAGYWLLLMLCLFLVWAYYFEIDRSVRAQGRVIPQERTQIIQAADGGVIESLNVVEGQSVRAGDVLASLEKNRASAGVEDVRAQMTNLKIRRIRAIAEAEGNIPDFGTYLQTHRNVVMAQQALFDQHRLASIDELASLRESLKLAEDERDILENLFSTGDVAKLDVVRMRREVVDLEGRILSVQNKSVTDARTEIAKIEENLVRQEYRLREQMSHLQHTDIVAPLDGVVKYLRINTLGGVLTAGDELMHISPTGGGNIIEAKIWPADIGALEPGLPATIRLDAFDYSIYGSLDGVLTYISSDTLSEQNGEISITYYRANIKVNPTQTNSRLDSSVLKPGMYATVDLLMGKRTVLEFIAKPVLRAFSGALNQR